MQRKKFEVGFAAAIRIVLLAQVFLAKCRNVALNAKRENLFCKLDRTRQYCIFAMIFVFPPLTDFEQFRINFSGC